MNNLIFSISAVLGFGIVFGKIYQLYLARKNNQKQIAENITELLENNSLQDTLAYCASKKSEAASQMAQNGIKELMAQGGVRQIQNQIDEIINQEVARIEKSIGAVALIANLTTLAGLIFTIIGLLKAFAGVSQVNPELKAKILSEGISLAMNSTAYGLAIAVPLLIAYSVLNNRANILIDDLSKAGLKVFCKLVSSLEPK